MPPVNSKKNALSYLARMLVDKQFGKQQLEALADVVLSDKARVVHVGPCTHGICVDHVFPKFDEIRIKDIIALSPGKVRSIDILIDGIVNPDAVRIRVGQELT